MALPELLKRIRPEHIPVIWEMLNRQYGFAIKPWQEKFEKEFRLQPRGMERVEFILVFGVRNINPVLNKILGRGEEYSSFLLMVGAWCQEFPQKTLKKPQNTLKRVPAEDAEVLD